MGVPDEKAVAPRQFVGRRREVGAIFASQLGEHLSYIKTVLKNNMRIFFQFCVFKDLRNSYAYVNVFNGIKAGQFSIQLRKLPAALSKILICTPMYIKRTEGESIYPVFVTQTL